MIHDEFSDSGGSDSSDSIIETPVMSRRQSVSFGQEPTGSSSGHHAHSRGNTRDANKRFSIGSNKARDLSRVSWGQAVQFTAPVIGESQERSESFRQHRREWSRVTNHLSRPSSVTRKRRFSTMYGFQTNMNNEDNSDPFKDPPGAIDGSNHGPDSSRNRYHKPNMTDIVPDIPSTADNCEIGEEPGIDMETTMVDLPDAVGSQVMVIDFSPECLKVARQDIAIGNKDTGLEQLLLERPAWSNVRWIVVNGLSWEAIGPIANFYDLHALALEDMLEIPQRTKVETFSEQVFCCFPLHILAQSENSLSRIQKLVRRTVRGAYYGTQSLFRSKNKDTSKGDPSQSEQRDAEKFRSRRQWFRRRSNRSRLDAENTAGMREHGRSISSHPSTASTQSTLNDKGPDLLKQDEFPTTESTFTLPHYSKDNSDLADYGECTASVNPEVAKSIAALPLRSIYQWNRGNDSLEAMGRLNHNVAVDGFGESRYVSIEQVSLFLMEGTVVTFFEKSAPAIIRPIIKRLESRSTLLRVTSDPAVLVQAVIDASVDMIEPVSVEYRSRLAALQLSALKRPTLTLTRKLSTLLRDLDLLRSTVSSLVKLTNTLGSKSLGGSRSRTGNLSRSNSDISDSDLKDNGSLKYRQTLVLSQAISDVAAIYFGDAADHALQYAGDLRTMRNHAKTLLMSIQNEMSIRGGDAIMMLSLVAVIFLPLSFLTGYFGMNFTNFKMLNNDVSYYWTIAGPSAGGLLLLLLWPWLMDGFRAVRIWLKAQLS